MATLISYISGKLRPWQFYITLFIIFIIFLGVGIYGYQTFYLGKKEKAFTDVANESARKKSLQIMFFHVEWCPHCVKAVPQWQAFEKGPNGNGSVINEYAVECLDYDVTDDNDPSNATLISKYKIESYPTIIIMKGDKRYDFDAKVTTSALEQFVQTASQD
jgi:thiol-disulfide isomerase/thioredoxin